MFERVGQYTVIPASEAGWGDDLEGWVVRDDRGNLVEGEFQVGVVMLFPNKAQAEYLAAIKQAELICQKAGIKYAPPTPTRSQSRSSSDSGLGWFLLGAAIG